MKIVLLRLAGKAEDMQRLLELLKPSVPQAGDLEEIGRLVRLNVLKDDGSTLQTKTRGIAFVLSGHTPVIMVEGISGAYLLDRVTPRRREDPDQNTRFDGGQGEI